MSEAQIQSWQSGERSGRQQSPEVRAKISRSLKGRPKTAQHMANAKAALQRPEVKVKRELARDRNRIPCPSCGRHIPPGASWIRHEEACIGINSVFNGASDG